MKRILLPLLLLCSLFAPPLHAQSPVLPERNRAAVVDTAHVLSPAQEAELSSRILTWNKATGHQMAVAIVPTLGGMDIMSYGVALGRKWGLGKAGVNDGLLFTIAMKEHKLRIDVGPRLQGDLTDADSGMILRNIVTPKMKSHDTFGGISAGVDAIIAKIPVPTQPQALAAAPVPNKPISEGKFIANLLAAICAVFGTTFLFVAWRIKREKAKIEQKQKASNDKVDRDLRDQIDKLRRQHAASRSSGPIFAHGSEISPKRQYDYTPSPVYRSPPPPSAPVIVPVIIPDTSDSYRRSSSDDSFSSPSWGSSDSSPPSSPDTGFDSGGGTFDGGGASADW
jgi:uncharacterized membrane protein YgcG